jgi:hypothetical protein
MCACYAWARDGLAVHQCMLCVQAARAAVGHVVAAADAIGNCLLR